MTPEMRIRVTAQNTASSGFQEAVRDSKIAADAIVANGRRASTALTLIADNSRQAANQQRNLAFQLNDVAVSLAGGANPLLVFAQQGSQIATIYGPEEGGVGRALKETANLATGLITKLWPVAAVVGAGSAALAGMQAEINKTSDVQVSFGDVALATWQTFSDTIYEFVQPAISAIGDWIGGIWDMARPALVTVGNGIIATFLGAFDGIKIAWSALPNVMGDVAYSTANNVIGGVEWMVNGAKDRINELIDLANNIPGVKLDKLGDVGLGDLKNPYEGAMSGVAEGVAGAFQGAFENDYLGQLFETISGKSKDNALARLSEGLDGVSKSTTAANDNFGGLLKTVKAGDKAFGDTATGALSALSQITGALSGAFEDNKALAAANIVVNTAQGIMKALAEGGPFGFPIAAAIGVAGAAQLASVMSAQPGSASVASVSGGGASAGGGSTAAAPAASSGPSIYLQLQGQRFSRSDIEGLIKDLNSAIKDGAKLQVA